MNFELATTMAKALRKKIGVAIVNAMPPDTTVWDTDLKGFAPAAKRALL